MARLVITQVKSSIKKPRKQKETIRALGLGKINSSVELEETSQIRGMIQKVAHLVNVSEA